MFYPRVLSKIGLEYQNKLWRNPWTLRIRLLHCSRPVKINLHLRPGTSLRNYGSDQQLSNTKNSKLENISQSSEYRSRISDFENGLFRRLEQAGFKRSKRFYFSIFFSTVIVIGAGYLYFFPHKLRQQVVEEVSTVASQSLEDGKIVTKAGQLSRDVLNDILNDEGTKVLASDFVKDVIVSQPIRDSAIGTILGLLNDPKVLELLRIRLSHIILEILQDDATRQIVLSQVNTILQHESIRRSLQNLLSDLISTAEVRNMMSEFFCDVLASDTVRNQGTILGQQVTADVISSKEIQEQAGNAIWSAVKHSVVPNIFKGKSNIVGDVTPKQDCDEKLEIFED